MDVCTSYIYQKGGSYVTKVAFAEDEGPFLHGSGKK